MVGLSRRDLATGAASVAFMGLAPRARARSADTAAFDRVLQGAVASGQIPGVVALAATDGDTVYHGAFGRRGLDRDAAQGGAMTPDSVFWIASMTKAITATSKLRIRSYWTSHSPARNPRASSSFGADRTMV